MSVSSSEFDRANRHTEHSTTRVLDSQRCRKVSPPARKALELLVTLVIIRNWPPPVHGINKQSHSSETLAQVAVRKSRAAKLSPTANSFGPIIDDDPTGGQLITTHRAKLLPVAELLLRHRSTLLASSTSSKCFHSAQLEAALAIAPVANRFVVSPNHNEYTSRRPAGHTARRNRRHLSGCVLARNLRVGRRSARCLRSVCLGL